MSGGQDESGADKQFEATPQKLDRARDKGEVPRSAELYTFAGYFGVVVVAALWGGSALKNVATALLPYIDHPEKIAALVFGSGNPGGLLTVTGRQVVVPLLPGFLVPFAAILAVGFATRSLTVTPSRLQPRLSRISLIQGAKRKFGIEGWFEFFKSAFKLIAMIAVLGWFVFRRTEDVVELAGTEPNRIIVAMLFLGLEFMTYAVIVVGVIAGIDWFWQRASHLRKNRMSHKEMRDESKEAEGDPFLKSARRQKAQDIAMNQIAGKVALSDVVIVNPTHFAVCLKWSRKPGDAPECLAKGVDEIALAIRKAAEAANVPIYSDPPTARAVFSDTRVGDQIDARHFRAVAAAIRFAEAMRRRARVVSQ